VLLAVLVLVPGLAVGYYYFPREISVYVYNRSGTGPIAVKLNGDTVLEESRPTQWTFGMPPSYTAKKMVVGPDLDFYIRAPLRDPLMERLSAFQGTHIEIYIDEAISIAQQTAAPPLY